MKNLFAMSVPILPGKTEQWKKFRDELNGKYADAFTESRKKLHVHERTFYQTSPQGDFVTFTIEGEEPEKAFRNFASANDQFSQWFTKEVKEIHGVDLRNPSSASLPKLVIDSHTAVLQD